MSLKTTHTREIKIWEIGNDEFKIYFDWKSPEKQIDIITESINKCKDVDISIDTKNPDTYSKKGKIVACAYNLTDTKKNSIQIIKTKIAKILKSKTGGFSDYKTKYIIQKV